MLTQKRLSDLIGMIYDATSAPHLWLRFIEEASSLLGAHISNLILFDSKQPASAVVQSYGLDQITQIEFSKRMHEDYWVAGGKHLPSGTVVLGSEIISLKDMRRTAYYREIAAPNEAEYMLGAVVENSPERKALISFIRGKAQGEFDALCKKTLALLMPHIQRAHYIHLQLANKASMEQVLDDSPYGVVLVDYTGSPIFVNRKAEHFFCEKDGMTLRYGALKFYDYTDQLELDRHLKHRHAGDWQSGTEASGMLIVRRPSGKLPYQMIVSAVSAHPNGSDYADVASYLLFIHDPTVTPSLSTNMLKTAYGLTDAEASLCERLFDGNTMDGAAEELGVSRNTVKTHLKHIFEKCDVNSQAALMRLLALGFKSMINT